MACCGQNRQRASAPTAAPVASSFLPGRIQRFSVPFEYTGRTTLTVIGGATGQRYRFAGSGARVQVDSRDRPSLAAVPNLREVR